MGRRSRSASDELRRFEASASTSLADVFAAYIASRPDEIPEAMRDGVVRIIEEVMT